MTSWHQILNPLLGTRPSTIEIKRFSLIDLIGSPVCLCNLHVNSRIDNVSTCVVGLDVHQQKTCEEVTLKI